MVHLNSVPNDSEVQAPLVKGLENIKFEQPGGDESHTMSVYGSRFAAEELPRHEMPEHEMPRDIAYRMIKDDLSLDGNPMLNLASFVTTYMVRHFSCHVVLSTDTNTGRGSRETHGGSSAQEFYRL